MKYFKLFIITILIATFFSGCISVFPGENWKSDNKQTTITYYIQNKTSKVKYYDNIIYSKTKEIKKLYSYTYLKHVFKSSFKYYEDICSVKFEETNISKDADIIFCYTDFDGNNPIARCHGSVFLLKDIPLYNHIIIEFNLEYNFSFLSDESFFEKVLKHEIGHALGLQHHSSKDSFMHKFSNKSSELMKDEKLLLQKWYGTP